MNGIPRFGFVVEYVADIEVAKRFYTEVLGLKVERSHPVWVQFDHFAIASDESLSGSSEPEVYWLVENAEAAYRTLAERAEIVSPLTEKPFGKVFGIKDPTGRACFILELASNRPSRPTP